MKHKLKLALILGVEFVAIAIVLILIFFSGKKQYTVIFDLDGGTLLSGDIEQHVTQGHSATPPATVKEGHYLRGWSGNYREVTHNVKITAIWEYETTPGIIYNDIDGDATYTEIGGCYKYLAGSVYIGAYHKDLKVLSIADGAFEDCTKITDIHLLDGILNIGNRAFAGCNAMTAIELPETTIFIGEYAFEGCDSLKSITLPESIEELGAYAFADCDSLEEVLIPSTIRHISDSAFEGCDNLKKVTFYQIEEEEDLFIDEDNEDSEDAGDETEQKEPENTEPYLVIGKNAFANCYALESINLPETLHTVKLYAFAGCSSLKSIVIPKSTVIIENRAFDTSGLTVYLYAESKSELPTSWASDWAGSNVTLSFGYDGENTDAEDGNNSSAED